MGRAVKPPSRKGVLAALRLCGCVLLLLGLAGCERGCARSWLEQHGATDPAGAPPAAGMVNAIDCSDGLARCVGGVVEVSRLATIPRPCRGAAGACECPWERAGDCDRGCVVEESTFVVDRSRATRQLCRPRPGRRAEGPCGPAARGVRRRRALPLRRGRRRGVRAARRRWSMRARLCDRWRGHRHRRFHRPRRRLRHSLFAVMHTPVL